MIWRSFIGVAILVLLSGCSCRDNESPATKQPKERSLRLTVSVGDTVRLLWFPPSHLKPDCEGFRIKRRLSETGGWEDRSPVLTPGISAKRAWDGEAFADGLANVLSSDLEKRLRDGALHEMSCVDFCNALDKGTLGLVPEAKTFSNDDFRLALLVGCAWVDKEYDRDTKYEYGLFLVRSDGTSPDEPETSRVVRNFGTNDWNIVKELSYEWKQEGCLLRWEVDARDVHEREIAGFELLRMKADGSRARVRKDLLFSSSKGQGCYTWAVEDRQATPLFENNYQIVPVTSFGEERPGTSYTVAARDQLDSVLTGVRAEFKRPGVFAVEWDMPAALEEHVEYFNVYLVENKKRLKCLKACVPPKDRAAWFEVADSTVEKGRTVSFEVVASRNGREIMKGESPRWCVAPPEGLPAPKRITADVIRGKKGAKDQVVRLKWEAVPGAAKYIVEVKYGQELKTYRLLAEIPGMDDPQCLHDEVESALGGDIYYRVCAVGKGGWHGAKASAVCHVPSLQLPPLIFDRSAKRGDGRILTWHWSYPVFPDLTGFRIYWNGKIAADEKALTPLTREWTTSVLETGKSHEFRIEAVSKFGAVSRPMGGTKRYIFSPLEPTNEELLRAAVESDNLDGVNKLITAGATLDGYIDGRSLTYDAALLGRARIVAALRAAGADLPGWNSLFAAVVAGDKSLVTEVSSRSPDLCRRQLVDGGFTPLMLAAHLGKEEQVACLTKQSDIDLVDNSLYPRGRNALMLALAQQHWETALVLVNSGARVDLQDELGISPLMQASVSTAPMRLFESILKRTSRIDQSCKMRYSMPSTALQVAASNGAKGKVEKLIAAGAKIDVADVCGNTPLMFAVRNKHMETACLLVKHGASARAKNISEKSPIDVAGPGLKEALELLEDRTGKEEK